MREPVWFSAHTHSQYSVVDGTSEIERMVRRVSQMGQPGIGFTDHGNMGGTVEAYNACKKFGVVFFPGVEAYLLDPDATVDDKNAGRFHVGLLALNVRGYQALVRLVSKSHTRPRFNRFPRITLDDLAQLSMEAKNDVALMTGCYFGLAQQTLVKKNSYHAELVVKMYASWFPHTFVEVQNHSIDHKDGWNDDLVVAEMMGIATRLGLPVMATQDSHYTYQSEKAVHALMKRMVYGGAEDEFPGDSFHLATDEWVAQHYTADEWDRAEEGAAHLLSLNKLRIPPLDVFRPRVPHVMNNANGEIRKRCLKQLQVILSKTPTGKTDPRTWKKYTERLDYELAVVKDMDMANYFVLVSNLIEWCKQEHICVEVRGSANASLMCHLLKITTVDPLKWSLTNVSFDRFMSRDRIKPPDVDLDVEDVSRGKILAYLRRHYEIVHICTWSELGTRVEDDKGSVLVTYQSYRARELEAKAKEEGWDPIQAKSKKSRIYASLQSIADVRREYGDEDYEALRAMAKLGSIRKSYGVHAGGILFSGHDLKISDWIPTLLVASSDTIASQFDQDSVEAFGALKLDVLGQTKLTAMRIAQELIGRKDPTDFTWIPDNDTLALRELRCGRTDTGVFHFEGYTKAKGGKELGIRSVKDVILAQALYMPGAMDTGQKDLYLDRLRNKDHRPKDDEYLHPIFKEAFEETFGAVVFQDQVVRVMRQLGMTTASVNKFIKVVKDSGKGAVERNRVRMAEVRDEFDRLCVANSITDTDRAWDQTAGFVAYGFNRAHATGYGLRSYRDAYLKVHYPEEWLTGLLTAQALSGGTKSADKQKLYVREGRRLGIRILPPDVNLSGPYWTLDKKTRAIRRGLSVIRGIGIGTAEEIADNAPYKSVEDLIERNSGRAITGGKMYLDTGKWGGKLGALRDAGALDSMMPGN